MLRLPPFTYVPATSVKEAVRTLAEHGEDAMVVAGGTDLFPNMKRRQMEPGVVVGLRGITDLRRLRDEGGEGVTLGPLLTLAEVSDHPAVRKGYPAVAKAAGLVSTPPLRNMGTVGGNLCVDPRCNYYNMPHPWRKAVGFCMKKDGEICLVAPGSRRCWALNSSDLSPVSLAVEAELTLAGPAGERVVAAEDFYRDDGIDYLNKASDEILTSIRLPPADGLRSTYWKLRRRGSFDFPILGVAAAVRMENGRVESARLALGAVASRPLLVERASQILEGGRPTEEDVKAAAEEAFQLAQPMDNADGHFYWRKRMVRPYVTGALAEVLGLELSAPQPREYH